MITINNYKNYTDEELFKLWKDINTDIKYNEENGICDSSEYDLYSVGIELMERKYLLDNFFNLFNSTSTAYMQLSISIIKSPYLKTF